MKDKNEDLFSLISETIQLRIRRGRRTVSTPKHGGSFIPGNLHYLDVITGSFTFNHPEIQEMTLFPGQGILIAPDTQYSIYVDGDSGEIHYGHIDFTVFGSVELGSVFMFTPLVSRNLTAKIGDCIERFESHRGSAAAWSLEKIVKLRQIETELMSLLLEHFSLNNSAIELLQSYRRLAPVLAYIKKNIHKPIKRRDLADIMNMSESRFSVVFSGIMNESPLAYVRNYKLREARIRMLANELSVKEAAAELGFCDEFHFSKMFKKYYGVSPGSC